MTLRRMLPLACRLPRRVPPPVVLRFLLPVFPLELLGMVSTVSTAGAIFSNILITKMFVIIIAVCLQLVTPCLLDLRLLVLPLCVLQLLWSPLLYLSPSLPLLPSLLLFSPPDL